MAYKLVNGKLQWVPDGSQLYTDNSSGLFNESGERELADGSKTVLELPDVKVTGKLPYPKLEGIPWINLREMAYHSSPIKRMLYMRDRAVYTNQGGTVGDFFKLIHNTYTPPDSILADEWYTPAPEKDFVDFYNGKIKENSQLSQIARLGNTALLVFLLQPYEQDILFKNQGYIRDTQSEKNNNYGLVSKAVGNRKLPIYQKEPDEIDRSEVVPFWNVMAKSYLNTSSNVFGFGKNWFGNQEPLIHAGSFPTTLYVEPKSGEIYLKGWDLNDYKGTSGSLDEYSDIVGNPVVVTTGLLRVFYPGYYLPKIMDRESADSLKKIYPNLKIDSNLFKPRQLYKPDNSDEDDPLPSPYNLHITRRF